MKSMQTLTLQNLYSKNIYLHKPIFLDDNFLWLAHFIKKGKLFALINVYETYVSNVSSLSIFAS